MKNTDLRYYSDSYQFLDTAKVVDIYAENNGRYAIVLDGTIMYPQGGGQPYDTGEIITKGVVFRVKEVRFKDGVVYHIGSFVTGIFTIGDTVDVSINEPRRRLHARLHTAGHLIDQVLRELHLGLQPVKGFHFPEGAYVEYRGTYSADLALLAKEIERILNLLIATDALVTSEIVDSIEALKKRGVTIPIAISANKSVRIVSALEPMPCGGTHVKRLGEVGYVQIPKVRIKDSNLRISYRLS